MTLPFILKEEVRSEKILPLHLVEPGDVEEFSSFLSPLCAKMQNFTGKAGDYAVLFSEKALDIQGALYVCDHKKGPLSYGVLAAKLENAVWEVINHTLYKDVVRDLALGFGLGSYHYSLAHNKTKKNKSAILILEKEIKEEISSLVRATWLGRDLINMPANYLGPQELASYAYEALSSRGAEVQIIKGEALKEAYPCLAAVGEGSERPSAVVIGKYSSSKARRRLSLVGKGVCFDTGGYNLKPGNSMLKMKKDMGGAALMLAFACVLIERDADIDLEIRLGCVENSVSGHAMRPGDVLTTRKGLKVEIGNTDAEGRLVLCDLLTEASETQPDLIIDAATLTGAARVALGPDLPALFSNDDESADALLKAGRAVTDPLWRLPLWQEYDSWLESSVADCNNVSSKPFAGAITAALYLQRFIPKGQKWLHIDSYAWNDASSYGRPEGGETLALRALVEAFK